MSTQYIKEINHVSHLFCKYLPPGQNLFLNYFYSIFDICKY